MKIKKPIIIGISGGSASGKSTLIRRIINEIGKKNVSLIQHDSYYRNRKKTIAPGRKNINYDCPSSLETDLLILHLKELKEKKTIDVPVYDFVSHRRTNTKERVSPQKIVIVEGILIFYDLELRSLIDYKIFIEADPDVRFIRRLIRDVSERGRTVDSVINQYLNTVKPMHDKYVDKCKQYADLILNGNKNVKSNIRTLANILRYFIKKGGTSNARS